MRDVLKTDFRYSDLSSAKCDGDWSGSRSVCLTSRYMLDGRLNGPLAGLDALQKTKSLTHGENRIPFPWSTVPWPGHGA